jgi:hypothetical protein
MSEHFQYSPDVFLGSPDEPEPARLMIINVENLVPIRISYAKDTGEGVMYAKIDYATQSIYFDDGHRLNGDEMKECKNAVLEFLRMRHGQYPINVPTPSEEELQVVRQRERQTPQ